MNERFKNIPLNRRNFFKLTGSVAVGCLVGEEMFPVYQKIETITQNVTNLHGDNAGVRQKIEDSCKVAVDKGECFTEYKSSDADKVIGIILGPTIEEFLGRGVVSAYVSSTDERNNESTNERDAIISDVVFGTRDLKMNKREFLIGVVDAALFGLAHNITSQGIDTKTVPVMATVAGMVLWILQRKLGIASNTAAHMWHNAKALI